MTDNINARVQILMERFDFCTSYRNPYLQVGKVFSKLLSGFTLEEVMPKEEELRAYD